MDRSVAHDISVVIVDTTTSRYRNINSAVVTGTEGIMNINATTSQDTASRLDTIFNSDDEAALLTPYAADSALLRGRKRG